MKPRTRSLLAGALVLLVVPAALRAGDAPPRALADYVARPENVYAWKIISQQRIREGAMTDVELISQTWQGIVWKHSMVIFEPAEKIKHPGHMLLFVTGGTTGRLARASDRATGMKLAELCQARVAMLFQVPNQPLLDGRKEDDLITETWLKYLETGDTTWPLLFPMVKSAVKAMDALQEIARSEWQTEVSGFVITGASKRGWTSWLTPAADPRVVGTAPMVIDVLNFRPQMKHQIDSWGAYSEQIHDYTSKGLVKEDDESPRELELRRMMDPYSYREQLPLPKLMIHGTNDPYWVVDALKLYWDDLVGPKYVLQVPNAGHGLEGGHDMVLRTIGSFFQVVVSGGKFPELRWSHEARDDEWLLVVQSDREPRAAQLWTAHAEKTDFRKSAWTATDMESDGTRRIARVPRPAQGHVARFAQLEFDVDGLRFHLSTVVRRD